MKNFAKLSGASAIALMLAMPVTAQDSLVGVEQLDDRIDDITDDVNEDINRGEDDERFGPNGVAQGWRGSLALTASGASGNTDTADVTGAGRMTYGVGDWNHNFGFALEYGEDEGDQNEEKFFATYEGNRYFTPEFYAFGIARYEYDGFEQNERDAFLGFGPGYRVINDTDHTWRVQAGPGVRYTRAVDSDSETEVGFIASSRYYIRLSETTSVTNDTDVLGSDANTVLTNDLGLNVRMSDNLSTRISYRTDYNTDPVGDDKSTDNTLGVSLVLGF